MTREDRRRSRTRAMVAPIRIDRYPERDQRNLPHPKMWQVLLLVKGSSHQLLPRSGPRSTAPITAIAHDNIPRHATATHTQPPLLATVIVPLTTQQRQAPTQVPESPRFRHRRERSTQSRCRSSIDCLRDFPERERDLRRTQWGSYFLKVQTRGSDRFWHVTAPRTS
jgi:hypothetical protein